MGKYGNNRPIPEEKKQTPPQHRKDFYPALGDQLLHGSVKPVERTIIPIPALAAPYGGFS